MKEPLIKRVSNNKEKSKTYSILFGKYNDAKENNYYGEAELIVYALLEDRLRAFLYHSNMLDSFDSNRINDNAKEIYGDSLDIKDMSHKISMIRKAMIICDLEQEEMTDFEQNLIKAYKAKLDPDIINKLMDNIEKWCKYRNEIIHAAFNKDIESLRKGYKEHVERGMDLARKADDIVKRLEKA